MMTREGIDVNPGREGAALNLDETREWLEIIYGDIPGYLHICSVGDWDGMTFRQGEVELALRYIAHLDAKGREGIYARVCTLRQRPASGRRGGDDQSFYLPGLWGDIDIAGPGHKTTGILPPDVTEAMKIVTASGLPPATHWIHSGGGLYPWWLLERPVEITDLEDFRSLSQGWQNALARGAEKLGYKYGSGVGDLSRVMRIPGTVNRKEGLTRPCTMLEGHAWNGPMYDLSDLVDALAAVTPEPPRPSPIQVKMSQGARNGERPGDEFNRTASWHDILLPHGWQWIRKQGDTWYLRRPGKLSGGHSATLKDSTDRLWVFSEEAHPLEAFRLYDKFGALAALEHGGDLGAAGRSLVARGYGSRSASVVASFDGTAAAVQSEPLVPVSLPQTSDTGQETPRPADPSTPVERPMLVCNEDRWEVLKGLTKHLQDRWDGQRLFDFGGVLCERKGITMRPLNKGALDALSVETCKFVNRKFDRRTQETSYPPALAEARILDMILARPDEFSKLEKLSQVPFVRPDGTICAAEGYDAATHTFLELDQALRGIDIPDTPTEDQVMWAKNLLLTDLLGDFPLHTDSDKANALATLLTPFVRDLVPVSPLAVIDAKEAGSGKNLLADIISVLFTGNPIQTLPYSTDDAEQRKVITSAFRDGHSVLLFDEAHVIEGANFARALTSHTYQDRILGSSVIAEFPNNRTWISLGNQVQIKGDMARRVYRVRLEYDGSRPESRPAESFRHPDLRQWALDNRAQLVKACLILIRAWYSLGKPRAPLPFRMGSFEKWQEILAGILDVAQVQDFLVNVPQWRSESDFERQHLVGHLEWLGQQYGTQPFTASQVTEAMKRDRTAEHPPSMDDPFPEGYARRLGQWFARVKDRDLDGIKLIRLESQGHTGVAKWMIVRTAVKQPL